MNTRPKQTPQPQDANINGIENAEYQDIEFDGELTDAEADVIHSEMTALVMKGGPTRTINILRRLTALSEQGLENVEVLLTKASEDKIALALKFV